MNKQKSIFVLLGLLLTMGACSDKRSFEYTQDVENQTWPREKRYRFEIPRQKTDTSYDLGLVLRHSLEYSYQNLYVRYWLKDSTGAVLDSSLRNVHLSDSKSGEPFGERNLGMGSPNLYTHEVFLDNKVRFTDASPYTIELGHYMRQDTIEGIFSVGVFAWEHEPTPEEQQPKIKETEREDW